MTLAKCEKCGYIKDFSLLQGEPCPNCGDTSIGVVAPDNLNESVERLNKAINDEQEEKYNSAFEEAYNSVKLIQNEINKLRNAFASLSNNYHKKFKNFSNNWQKVQSTLQRKHQGYSVNKVEVQKVIKAAEDAITLYVLGNNENAKIKT